MDDNSNKPPKHLPQGNKALPGDMSKWSNQNQGQPQQPNQLDDFADDEPIEGTVTEKKIEEPPKREVPAFPTAGKRQKKEEDRKSNIKRKKANETLDFIAESKMVVQEDAPANVKASLYFIIIVIICSVVYAANADIDITVNANGKVVPTSHIQVVQNLEGGIISNIRVKEGNIVKQGQTLVEMDDTRFKSEYNEKLAKLNALQSEIYRLRAESEGKDKIDFPEEFSRKNKKIVEHANIIFHKNRASLEKNLAVLKQSYNLAKKEYDIVRPLARQGVMSDLELIRLEREVNTFKGKITEMEENVRNVAREEMNKMKNELHIVQEQITASRDRMIRTEVKSPVDGIVNKLHITSIGEVITPDEKILEIVPLDDKLSIQLKIQPADIGFIKKNQKVSVKISAYDYAIYGDVKGKVKRISSDSIKNEKGEEFYHVIVEAEKNYIGKPEDSLTILPGMTVTGSITTTKRSILSYFLKPLFKIKEEAFVAR